MKKPFLLAFACLLAVPVFAADPAPAPAAEAPAPAGDAPKAEARGAHKRRAKMDKKKRGNVPRPNRRAYKRSGRTR